MAKKDVNIHVKTPGAEEAKRHLDDVARSANHVGEKTADSSAKFDQATVKISNMGNILSRLKTQVVGFLGAWLGLEGVQRLISGLIAKLERVVTLQKEIYDQSIDLNQVGQSLEMQTGTVGQQQQWTQKALALQQAGGLRDIGTAQQMMVSMDIAFAAQGGIKNPEVLGIANQLAPFVGANQLGGQEVTKLFEFAGTAGIAPTAGAYTDYFAKLQAGYTASKATDFGQFMIGLQKGGTAYMAAGGSLESVISQFSGARSVMANESLAATLMEQSLRLSSGGNIGVTKAIEESLGVNFAELSTDQRQQALLDYIQLLPEATRIQSLVAQGMPAELATGMSKLVSPEALTSTAAASTAVGGARAESVDKISSMYLRSPLGRERALDAKSAAEKIEASQAFTDWQQRLKGAKSRHDVLVAKGEDLWSRPDSAEPYLMVFDQMLAELSELEPKLSGDDVIKARRLRRDIMFTMGQAEDYPVLKLYPSRATKAGIEYGEQLGELKQTTIIYDNSVNYQRPIEGASPRYSQD